MKTTVSESRASTVLRVPRLWVVAHPEHFGAVRAVPRGASTFGRDVAEPWGDWTDLPGVSRRHARLERSTDGLRLVDLDSHNGTWVNTSRVRHSNLSDGDVIRIGGLVMVLRLEPPDLSPSPSAGELIGISAEHHALCGSLARLAASSEPVLITGESGVGKELASRRLSPEPAVVVDGRSLVPEVVASDLFGQSEGAFPGAIPRRGAIERTGGGLLLLDGLDESPRELHSALLRWLGTGHYRPVGSDRPRTSTCRVVATTTTLDGLPPALIARFSSTIELPPLRTRRQDIAAIARQVVGPLPARVMAGVLVQPWPGNGRQLTVWLREQQARGVPAEEWPLPETEAVTEGPTRPSAGDLRRILERHGGNVRRTAEALGVARTTLYRWVEASGIDLGEFRP